MSTLEIVALVALVALALAWYLSYTAARLHRLQTRVEGALAALDAHLVRRAEAAVELSNSGILDPATSLILASAAAESLDSGDTLTALDWEEGGLSQRELVESALTHALRIAIPRGDGEALSGSLRRIEVPPAGSPAPGPGARPAEPPRVRLRLVTPDGTTDPAAARESDPEAVIRRVLDAHRRVQLSRRFYNDAVVDVQRVRNKNTVALFRLAGHATIPRTVEFDDDLTVTESP